MTIGATAQLEKSFLSLPRVEREAIISYGTAIRLSALKKRQFLAQSKVRHFEGEYKLTLEQLEKAGLPDDAGYEMHEDYLMWRHWHEVESALTVDIANLEQIARQGLMSKVLTDAGD